MEDEADIRRQSPHFTVRSLTPHAADDEPMGLLVEAPAADLRRLVVVAYVDFRTGYREPIEGVVRFSKKGESPEEKRNLRLATPADFREKGYEPGIADDLDAVELGDVAPYLARQISRGGGATCPRPISRHR